MSIRKKMQTQNICRFKLAWLLAPILMTMGLFFLPSCNKLACENKEQKEASGECKSTEPSAEQESSTPVKKIVLVLASAGIAGNNINLVADSKGNLFYPTANTAEVQKVDTSGIKTTFATGVGSTGGYSTIAIDKNDNLYVATPNGIKKITWAGVVSNFANFPSGEGARQMAVDSLGNIYYTAFGSPGYTDIHTIRKVTPAGVFSTFAGSETAGNSVGTGVSASFNAPKGIAIDASDNIYIADVGNFVVKKITPSGNVTIFAGSGVQQVQNGTGVVASFYFYGGMSFIAFDSEGNLLVGDPAGWTGYIRKISPVGEVSTFCGGGSNTTINSGSCDKDGVWVNMGMRVLTNGAVYFLAGESLYVVK